ncbi:MAG: hypothetical protein R3D66_05720 [Alphaproteobacteria bacterium]
MNGFLAKPIDPEKLDEILWKIHKGELDHPVILEEVDSRGFLHG